MRMNVAANLRELIGPGADLRKNLVLENVLHRQTFPLCFFIPFGENLRALERLETGIRSF